MQMSLCLGPCNEHQQWFHSSFASLLQLLWFQTSLVMMGQGVCMTMESKRRISWLLIRSSRNGQSYGMMSRSKRRIPWLLIRSRAQNRMGRP